MIIHCIGDSHVCVFSGQDGIDKEDILPYFKTYRIGAPTAYNSFNKKDIIKDVIENNVKFEDMIMLSFGEIDCRTHIIKQTELQDKSIEYIINDCMKKYSYTIEFVKLFNKNILIWNIPPTSINHISGSKYVTYGTFEQRNEATKLFNMVIQKYCEENNLKFISIYDEIIMEYFIDEMHLSQKIIPIVLNKLKDIIKME